MSEDGPQGDDFLTFSQEPYEEGNRSKQFNRGYRGNNRGFNNRQRFGFGSNQHQQQQWSNQSGHNRSHHNRSNRQHQDNSFGQHKRGECSIQDYIHPSMWEDPWEHCKKMSDAADESLVREKNQAGFEEQDK